MADPAQYRPKTGDIPTDPGVYRFRDDVGRVIYVGKAKNLRNRLTSYFAKPEQLAPKTYAMVHTAAGVEWTVVGSELESLQPPSSCCPLECSPCSSLTLPRWVSLRNTQEDVYHAPQRVRCRVSIE